MQIINLSLDRIDVNPEQPRKVFEIESLQGLAQSIRESGLIQPVAVYKNGDGKYHLIDGERRWRAAKLAGLKSISAVVEDKPERPGLLAVIANLQREDLNPIEVAQAYRMLKESGLSNAAIAHRIGSSQSTVASRLKLLELEPEIQQMIISETMPSSSRAVDALLSIENSEHRVKMAQKLARTGLKIKTVETACRKFNEAMAAAKPENLPAVYFAARKAGEPNLAKWDMLRQAGQVPPWPMVEQAARAVCDGCPLRDTASATICQDCPGVLMISALIRKVGK
jgi:ParB/RepB/Spo0J family partition protein